MENNKKCFLISKWKELKSSLLQIKEQNESVFLVDYEDLVKTMFDGYLINWVSLGSSEKLNKEIKRLILERVNNYKKEAIKYNSYDNKYYDDVLRRLLEEKGIILEVLNSKPYSEAALYMKKIIDSITDEEINNYIRQDRLNDFKVFKRFQ